MVSREEIEKLLKVEGKVKGVVFQTDAYYVLQKEGEEGHEVERR